MASSGDGTSWSTAFKTIQEAVNASVMYDEIWVKEGTYALESTIEVDEIIAIYAGFDGSEANREERDWNNNVVTITESVGALVYHCFNITADATVDGFKIQGCRADGSEGEDEFGGGMYILNSSPTIKNSIFIGNIAHLGGGIHNSMASPNISRCIFMGNHGTAGGGIFNDYSSPVITGCTFSGNDALAMHNGGGGIHNLASSPIITNCIFSDNFTFVGGGIANYDSSSPLIINSIFYRNWVDRVGGAVRNYNSSPTIINCTFFGNHAGYYGGAIFNQDSSTTITNSILWGDTGHLPQKEIHDWPAPSSVVSYCDIDQDEYEGIDGNIRQDPLFVDSGNDDFHLTPQSPCRDAGTGSAPELPVLDFEGDPRIIGSAPDIGADEF